MDDEYVGTARPASPGSGGKDAPRAAIIVALDLPDAEAALDLARTLRGHVDWVKVGMTLYYANGPAIVRELRSLGFKVFVDLKLNDIPHQVEGAARALTRVGADMITVHASGGRAMLEAAVSGAASAAAKFNTAPPAVVAVTVLTSLDADGLAEVGVDRSPAEQVALLAASARDAGLSGVVCSPEEASSIRELLGPDALVVTPGVRPTGTESGDQARVATPAEAVAAGASHLVIGRPITAAPDPVEAVKAIVKELAS
ncbi:MAG: orotidine-5'-phosphate decarboxylase [Coriobacteriia bacterium]|nr:orotidine-5'-phosphate decarboxylase [Coriobacteriia bacterium]